jgi:hypothetical protein
VCYLGTANNAGAILVVGRGLVVVPKLIHPIPPPLQSPESSPERVMDETWMQVSLLLCTVFNNNWKNAFAKWGNAYELIFCLFLL